MPDVRVFRMNDRELVDAFEKIRTAILGESGEAQVNLTIAEHVPPISGHIVASVDTQNRPVVDT